MLTILVAVAVGLGGFFASHTCADAGLGWSIFFGILAFMVFQAVTGFLLQKRVRRDMERVQGILLDGQKRLQAKMQRWQFRPPGSPQAAQKEIFDETRLFVKEALDETEKLRRYRLVVPMMGRQIATAKLQLNWMIKDFREVDTLMKSALFIDPTMSAIKMARLFMLKAPTEEIAKVYQKAVRRTRYNGNVTLAATMSWIQVQRDDTDGAFKTLTEALKKSDNEILKRNHETLMNRRAAHFSNSGLGDTWYALHLEEPKVRMQRPRGGAFR